MIHTRHLSFITALLCAALVSVSCSTIKEDRAECETYLTVNVDDFIAAGFTEATLSYRTDEGDFRRESFELAPYEGVGYEIPVRRGRIAQTSVIAGIGEGTLTDGALYAEQNCPFGRTYAFAGQTTPTEDLASIRATPHKQHCKVTFRFPEGTPDDVVFPYVLRVRASFNGFDIFDLSPEQTDYEICTYPGDENGYAVILPRQADYDIRLDIILPGDGFQAPGQVLYSIDLGKRFIDAGYDWQKEDLNNIDVVVDFSRAAVEIVVKEWDKDDSYSDTEI